WNELGVLGQFYADMHGWEEMVALFARAYESLTDEEKEKCVLIGFNYGEAGALDFLGKKYGLPNAISTHNNYHLWGPGERSGDIAISLMDREILEIMYERVEQFAVFDHEYNMPYERGPLYICRNLTMTKQEIWKRFKNFN
ncbi:glycosyltransferase, partial [candidate division KSB1 bacterium]